MGIDVTTLFYLIIGTTMTGAVLMAWERQFNPVHRFETTLWACGLLMVSAGCLMRLLLGPLPPFVGIGLSNAAVLAGYAAIASGTIMLARGSVSRAVLVLWAAAMVGWFGWGRLQPVETRIVFTSTVCAVMCFQTVAAFRPAGEASRLTSRRLVRALFAMHGLFFTGRVVATLAVPTDAATFQGLNFAVTMVEGILWSTLVPPAFLMMARENTERRLTADSETDYLTGIDNRRAFMTKAARLVSDPAVTVAVAVFDLDHFKIINDRYGHDVGDGILRQFCRSVEEGLMPGDVFGRIGGEEFAVVFRGCEAPSAQKRAAAMSRLYTAEVAHRFALAMPATVSGGVAQRRAGADLAQLLREADAALYDAKTGGRDRVFLAKEDAEDPSAPPAPQPSFA